MVAIILHSTSIASMDSGVAILAITVSIAELRSTGGRIAEETQFT